MPRIFKVLILMTLLALFTVAFLAAVWGLTWLVLTLIGESVVCLILVVAVLPLLVVLYVAAESLVDDFWY